MSKCFRINKLNNEPSILFDKLYNIFQDESLAEEAYKYFNTDTFKNKVFGDYVLNNKLKQQRKTFDNELDQRTDKNGEPVLYDSDTSKPYYLDLNNEKIYYPNNLGLERYMESDDIYLFAKTLALNYFSDEVNYNYKDQTFELESNLKNYIREFIDRKVNNLDASDNIEHNMLSDVLNDTRNSLDDWINEVSNYYASINIEYKIDNEYLLDEDDKTREDLVRIESFLKSSKDNVSKNIKLMLSLLKSDKVNKFDEYDFVEYDDVYSTLNKKLSNKLADINEGEKLFDIYMDEIIKLSKVKPYLNNLFDVLNSNDITDTFKNQFASTFNLFKKNYLVSEYTQDDKGNITYSVMNLTDAGSRKRNLLNNWLFQLTEVVKTIPKDSNDKIEKKFKLASKRNNINDANVSEYITDLKKVINSLGVNFSDKAFDYLMKDFDVDKELSIADKITFIKDSYKKIGYALSFYKANPNDNLFLNQTLFTKLAESEAFFQETGTDASVFTLGKTKWFYANPSHLDVKLKEWQNDPSLLIKHYDDTSAFNKSSHWMEYLSAAEIQDTNKRIEESRLRLEGVLIGIFNSVQEKNNSMEGSDNKSISYLDSYVDYMNKVLAYRKGGKVFYKTALAADKSTGYEISYGDNKGSNKGVFSLISDLKYDAITQNFNVSDDVLEIFYKYWKGEYTRIAEEYEYIEDEIRAVLEDKNISKEDLDLILVGIMSNDYATIKDIYGDVLDYEKDLNNLTPNYHYTIDKGNFVLGNALKMNLFESLSDNSKIKLYDVNNKPLYLANINDKISIKNDIKAEINRIISDNIKSTHQELIKNNVFKYNKNAKLENNHLDKEVFNNYSKSYDNNLVFFNIAADYFINSVVSQVEYSKMFSGDIAYYKNIADYKKRVPATYTDGKYLMNLEKDEKDFNASIIGSVEIAYQDMDELKKTLDKEVYEHYESNINDADAQAWITPERWYFLMDKLGKITPTVDSMYTKMNSGKKEVFTPQELKVLAQPLKGVYFDVRDGVPVYLKYSQAVLLPNLIKGTKLEDIYNKMVPKDKNGNKVEYNKQIHELITKDGIKVGYPTPSNIHTKEGGLREDFQLQSSIIKLSNSKWKLQQDLPTKGIKATAVGSQIQINIFQGLVKYIQDSPENSKKFIFGNEEVDVNQMIDLLNGTIESLSNIGLEEFKEELGIDDNFNIKNEEVLYSGIIKQLKQRSDVNNNNIKGLEMGLSPLGIPGINKLFQNVFSSLLNNKVVKIKTNGGGFIQMANYGISKENSENQNIIYTPWHDKDHLPMPEVYYDEYNRKRLKPSGIFLSGSWLAKIVPNYKKYNSKELFGTAENNYTDGLIDKRLLENIIGYRIPNQGLPSSDALQILGILPEETGDTVIAYTGITTKTGSDFDIDKMYLMMGSYNVIKEDYNNTKSYIFKNLKGENKKETVNNVLNLLNKIDPLNELDLSLMRNINYLQEVRENLESSNINYFISELDYGISNYEGDDIDILNVKEKVVKQKIVKIEYVDTLVEGNEKKYHQNRLIELYKSILTDPDVINDVFKPIDLKFIEKDIKLLLGDKVETNDMSQLSGINDIKLKEEFRSGKSSLGQNINSLVDSVRGSMATMKLNKGKNFDTNFYMGNSNDRNEPIFDLQFSEELTSNELNYYRKEYEKKYGKVNKEEFNNFHKKLDLNTSMMVYVNGFVDIAKDSYITQGNWVTQTNDVGFMLIRAGVHPFKVNALLNQPYIKDYVAYKDKFESVISNEKGSITTKFLLNKLIENNFEDKDITINNKTFKSNNIYSSIVTYDNVKKYASAILKYKSEDTKASEYSKLSKEVFSLIRKKFNASNSKYDSNAQVISEVKELHDEIMGNINSYFTITKDDTSRLKLDNMHNQIKDYNPAIQLQHLDYFNELVKKARVLSLSMKVNKAHTDGKGKDNITALIYSNIYDKYYYNENEPGYLSGFSSKFTYNGNNTILKTYFDNSVKFGLDIMKNNPKYFITSQTKPINTFNYISKLINDENLINEKLGQLLEKEYTTYVLSSFEPFQIDSEERRDLIKNAPTILKDLKDKHPDNLFLNELYNKKIEGVYYVAMSNTKKSNYFKNKISRSWFNLLKTDYKEAEKLIKYSYVTSGFNNNDMQFHEYIPSEWFNSKRFNSHLKTLNLKDSALDYNFLDQFFRNNLENSSISVDITSEANELVIKEYPSYLLVNLPEEDYKTLPYLLKLKGKDKKYKYYKQQDLTKEGDVYYTRVEPLSYRKPGILLKEYDMSGDYNELSPMKSMFKTNDIKDITIDNIRKIIRKYPFQPPATYDNGLGAMEYMLEETTEESTPITKQVSTIIKKESKPFDEKVFKDSFETLYKPALQMRRPDLDMDILYEELLEIGKTQGMTVVKDYIKKCKKG